MTSVAGKFGDLGTRIVSALFLIAIGGAALYFGGLMLGAVVSLAAGAMVGELAKMLQAKYVVLTGLVAAVAVFLWFAFGPSLGVMAVGAAVISTVSQVKVHKGLYVLSHLLISIGAVLFIEVGLLGSGIWIFWLVGTVVLTDVGGYFAGKVLGGPKFWPSISPKKTWSGILAGWIASAIFAAVLSASLAKPLFLMAIAGALISFASQLGDIFESAVKRKAGVKDSSYLIPGHGGVWDRFDGMLAAAIACWPIIWVI